MKANERQEVLLAWQQGLLGEVSPSLRGVTIGFPGGNAVQAICYYDGPVGDAACEAMSVAETELYSSNLKIDSRIDVVRCDHPNKMQSLDVWVFLRKKDVGCILPLKVTE